MTIAVKAIAAVVALAAVDSWWHLEDVPRPCDVDPNWSADTALVPSGDPGYRTRFAVRLYSEERVEKVAISGAGHGGDAAEQLAKLARTLDAEVPLVLETEARSTEENMANTCALLGEERVAIVTDRHHARRAYLTALAQCPQWKSCTAPVDVEASLGTRIEEALKVRLYQLTGRASWTTRP